MLTFKTMFFKKEKKKEINTFSLTKAIREHIYLLALKRYSRVNDA